MLGEASTSLAFVCPDPLGHAQGAAMTTWEYLTTPLLIHNTPAILNNWGKQGWELVQVVTGPEGGLVAYLKRPVGVGEENTGLGAAATAARQFEGGAA